VQPGHLHRRQEREGGADTGADMDGLAAFGALAQTLLAAVMLEMSSLGTDRSRELRNRAVHGDVAAVRVWSRRLADCPLEADR
jgi:hypothetical protein